MVLLRWLECVLCFVCDLELELVLVLVLSSH